MYFSYFTYFYMQQTLFMIFLHFLGIIMSEYQNSQQICQATKVTKQYELKITLKQENNGSFINLRLDNKQNFDVYELKIDDSFLKHSEIRELCYLFSVPKLLFEQMKEIIDQIQILDNGIIKFNIAFGRNGIREIKLPLQQKKVDKVDFLLQKINDNRNQLRQEMTKMRAQANDYMYEMRKQYCEEIHLLKKQLVKTIDDVKALKEIIEKQEEVIKRYEEKSAPKQTPMSDQKIKAKLIDKIMCNKNNQKTIKKVSKSVSSKSESEFETQHSQKKYQPPKENSIRKEESPKQIKQLYPLGNNPFYSQFLVGVKQDSVLITKKDDNGFYNYVPQLVIPPNCVKSVTMKQQHTKSQYIMFGIGTKNVIGIIDAFYRDTSMAYFSNNGWIYKNGGNTNSGPRVRDGSYIKMTVDTIRNQIQWKINDSQILSEQISTSIQGKQIYVMIMMAYSNDSVRLMFK